MAMSKRSISPFFMENIYIWICKEQLMVTKTGLICGVLSYLIKTL